MAEKREDVNKLISNLQKIIGTVGRQSNEQLSIHRELNKVITLLSSGLARNEQDARDLISKVEKGMSLTDEVASKWASDRKVTKKDLDQILKKFAEIERVNQDIKKVSDDLNESMDDRLDKLEDEFDLSKKLFESYDEIHNAVLQSKKAVAHLGSATEGIIDGIIEKKIPEMIKTGLLSSMFDDMFNSMTSTDSLLNKIQTDAENLVNAMSGMSVNVPMSFDINSGQLDEEISKVGELIQLENQARLSGLVEFFGKNTELQDKMSRKLASQMPGSDISFDIDTGELMKANQMLVQGTLEYQNALDELDNTIIDKGILGDVSQIFLDISDLISMGVDRTAEQNSLLDNMLSKLNKSSQFLSRAVIERQSELDVLKNSLQYEKDRLKLMGKFSVHMQLAENAVNKVGQGFDYINSILPAGLGNLLGLQRISFTLIDSHREGVKSFFSELSKGQPVAKAVGSYLGEFGPSLKLVLNPTVMLIAAIGILYKITSDITNRYKEMAKEMKISLVQAQQLLDTQLDISTSHKNQFATMQDIQEAQVAMLGSSGKVATLMSKSAKDLTLNLIETGKAFGYGTTQAVELQGVLTGLGADNELALRLQQNIGYMSEMIGLSPQIVSNDLIEGSAEVATYFAGMPEQAAKAVIQIRKMGMNLKQAGQIAQNMLNLEGFMTDMYELQAMTGGGVDFSSAFDKGLMGDIEGMTEDIMNNIGSTAKLNSMDYLTRIKIAKTLGMSVEDLAKSVKLREDMVGLSDKEQSYLKANLDRMGDVSLLSQDQIKSRLQELQSTDRLNVAWDKIKGTLLKALLPAIEIVADAIDAISPILDGIVQVLKLFGGALKLVFPIIKGLLFPFKLIGSVLDGILSVTDGIMDRFKGVGDVLSGVGDIAEIVGGIIGSVFVIKNAGAFFSFITTGFASIFKMVLGIFPLIGSLGKTIIEYVTGVSLQSKSVVTTSVASISSSADTSIQTTAQVAESAISNIESVSSVAANAVQDGAVKSGAALSKLQTTAKKPLISKKSFTVLGTLGASVFTAVAANAAQSFFDIEKSGKDSMSSMSNSILPIFGTVIPMIGPMLFDSLYQGVERFFRKRLEKTLEKKFIGSIDKITDKFKGIDKPIIDSVENASQKSKGILGKTFDKVKSFVSKPFIKKTKTITENVDENVLNKKTDIIDQSKKTIKDTETIDKVVKPEPVKPKPVEKPEKIKLPKTESIDTKPMEKKSKDVTKTISDSFKSISDTISSVWKKIKSALTDIVKFAIDIVKQMATGIVDVGKILIKGLSDISNQLFGIVKSLFKTLKTVLGDVVSIVENAMKSLSRGIGTAIKNVLKGIGDGLSSFKTTAITGAAALVVLSGALWISSKALQNFATVEWDSIAKSAIVLGGLVGAAFLLQTAAPIMIVGAAAIAVLGASLLPMAFAMGKFNDIEWSSMAEAGSVVGDFGIAIAKFGLLSPMILAGTMSMGMASLAIYGFGKSISYLSDQLSLIDVDPIESLVDRLNVLSHIRSDKLFLLSAAITSIGASMMAFGAMQFAGSITSALSDLFGNDIISDLERLANIADPLLIMATAIKTLSSGLNELSVTMNGLDFSNLKAIEKFDKISIDQKMVDNIGEISNHKKQPEVRQVSEAFPVPTTINLAQPLPPRKESVAQDVSITKSFKKVTEEVSTEQNQIGNDNINKPSINRSEYSDIYNRPEMTTKKMELLLQETNKLLQIIAGKNPSLNMDGYRVGSLLKKQNNNI